MIGLKVIRFNIVKSFVRQPNVSRTFASFGKQRNDYEKDDKKALHVPKNEEIEVYNMRVVYQDQSTGESKWKLLNRDAALEFARSMGADLILVSANSNPPVCKLGDYSALIKERLEVQKVITKNIKKTSMKEMTFSAGIEQNDLITKMNKTKKLLAQGHPVKVAIIAKRQTRKSGKNKSMDNPKLAVDETTMKILECLEDLPVTIQAEKSKLEEKDEETGFNPLIVARKDFIFSQKIDKQPAVEKKKKSVFVQSKKAAEILKREDEQKAKIINKRAALELDAEKKLGLEIEDDDSDLDVDDDEDFDPTEYDDDIDEDDDDLDIEEDDVEEVKVTPKKRK